MPNRPIRDLINTSALKPLGKGGVARDRRKSDRFSCRLPGILSADGKETPIECLDISGNGIRVSSQRPVVLKTGQETTIRVKLGAETFEDRYLFIKTSPGVSAGATLMYHFRLL